MVSLARLYWDDFFDKWKKWRMSGAVQSLYPLAKEWEFPRDAEKKNKLKWGNCIHASNVLPEPYWGNPDNPSVVFVNINPGRVTDIHSKQLTGDYSKLSYYDIAAQNILDLSDTQNWHSKRFKWAVSLDPKIDQSKGLSIELIPWHSHSASDVAKYIHDSRLAVIDNLFRFSKVLPQQGIFKNTFIVRSAAFMDLLCDKDFASFFDTGSMTHYILARKGFINKPISFLSIVNFKQAHGGCRFIIFHGGSNNDMPKHEYIVLGVNKSLKSFIEDLK